MRVLDDTGAELAQVPLGEAADPLLQYRCLRRGDLNAALQAEAAHRGIVIRHGARLASVQEGTDSVTAHFTDGSTATGDLLLGADGLSSTVRQLTAPDTQPLYAGQRVFYGYTDAAPRPEPHTGITMVRGSTAAFGYAVSPDGETYWFARVAGDPLPADEIEHGSPAGWRELLVPLLRKDATPAADIVAATGDDVMVTNSTEIPTGTPWRSGRTLLIGDAAHAASPATGQGASMALEDAVVLAKCLRDAPDTEAALSSTRSCAAHAWSTTSPSAATSPAAPPRRPPTGARPRPGPGTTSSPGFSSGTATSGPNGRISRGSRPPASSQRSTGKPAPREAGPRGPHTPWTSGDATHGGNCGHGAAISANSPPNRPGCIRSRSFTENPHRGIYMRIRVIAATATAAGTLAVLAAVPAHATEYSSALKIKGVQYDAPGRDSNSCTTGNTKNEYLTIKNYSSGTTVNLKGYVVKDKTGNKFTFTKNHYLQPGDYVKLRGGRGTDSDANNVVYRNNCNFIWNNDKDTIYLYKPSGAHADTHAYTKSANDKDGNGYITYHG